MNVNKSSTSSHDGQDNFTNSTLNHTIVLNLSVL